jgi:hypothetical protein
VQRVELVLALEEFEHEEMIARQTSDVHPSFSP